MSATVPQVFVNTYERNVRHLAQQGIARLRPYVDERSVQAEAHNWERIASTAATAKTTRKQATPDDETEWSRRVSVPKTYNTGDVTEQEDIVQMLIDPNSNYARAQGMAMKRAFDDEIINAAYGTALDGDGNNVALPAGQSIGDGLAGSELSLDLVTQVTEQFLTNDIDPDEPKVWVVSPGDMRALLNTLEATSGDYNTMRPLQSKGYVESWMGYSWVTSTRLALNATQPTNGVNNIVMTKKALGLQVNRDISVRIAEDPSISFAHRIYCFATFGAVRVEDEHMMLVNTTGAPAP